MRFEPGIFRIRTKQPSAPEAAESFNLRTGVFLTRYNEDRAVNVIIPKKLMDSKLTQLQGVVSDHITSSLRICLDRRGLEVNENN